MPNFFVLIPRDAGQQAQLLTDEEADILYGMWKSSSPGARGVAPPSGKSGAVRSLKAKGYVSGIDVLELTERGRKVIVEMATREPNALDRRAMPAYSDIKKSANKRSRQTFTRTVKSAGSSEANSFNLHRRRMERDAGAWDWMTSPVKDWAAQQWSVMKDWWGSQAAQIGGKSFELLRAVRRQVPIAQRELEQLNVRTQSGGGVSPQAVESVIQTLKSAMQQFYALTSKSVGLPPLPSATDPKYQSRTVGGMDQQGFMAFYNDLSRAVASVNENTALDYEKHKNVVTKAPTAQPGPEDKYLGKNISRMLADINRISNANVVDKPILDEISKGNIPTSTGNVNLIEKINNDVKSVSDQGDIDNVATDIISMIFDDLVDAKLQAHLSRKFPNPTDTRARLSEYDRMSTVRERLEKYVVQIMNEKYKRLYEYRSQQPQAAPAGP
jgi:hypothetical protein